MVYAVDAAPAARRTLRKLDRAVQQRIVAALDKLGEEPALVRPSSSKARRASTGFGVDKDLLSFEEIWAAAGTPHAVFRTTHEELVRITGGEVVDVREESG